MITGGRAKKIFESKLLWLLEDSTTILDVGTSQRFAKELRQYESWFNAKEYFAAGFNPDLSYGDYNCDMHQDIERLSLENDSIDAIICLEVLEHVKNPTKAIAEMFRVLKPGGKILLTTPFLLAYHGKTKDSLLDHSHGSYPDFWRFTHEGLELLFSRFSNIEIEILNGPVETGIMVFNLIWIFRFFPLRNLLDVIDRPLIGKQTSRHLVTALK